MSRVLVVYESMWGNTAKIAQAIAAGLTDAEPVDLTDVHQAPTRLGDEVELVVAGGPTHALSMSRKATRADAIRQGAPDHSIDTGLREWLGQFPDGAHAQLVATFDTRVQKARRLPGSAAKAAARTARRHGFRVAKPAVSFYVQDLKGPLLDRELDRATEWGRRLADDLIARRRHDTTQ